MSDSETVRRLLRRKSAVIRFKESVHAWYAAHRETLHSGFFSLSCHALMLFLMALVVFAGHSLENSTVSISSEFDAKDREVRVQDVEMPRELTIDVADSTFEDLKKDLLEKDFSNATIDFNDLDPSFDLDEAFSGPVFESDNAFAGRSREARSKLLASQGGNAASERAVELGLQWLARHQNSDGSWSFDHVQDKQCATSCTEPGGYRRCRMGATAMALLCYLGAGQTHHDGDYQEQVSKGLEFLVKNMRIDDSAKRGDLRGANQRNSGMYVQGLATIALTEAYGLTRDRKLRRPAALALNFIEWAQDPSGGGWRYQPRQPGDTSVIGWQVMALASARMANLSVRSTTFTGATRFLNRVADDEGAMYGYMRPGSAPSTTSIGLLCRMYIGWEADHPALKRGVSYLSQVGPSKEDMYYNYYATQVLHHWGGEPWKEWNAVMRDWLIETQRTDGHARGSWDPRDFHAHAGGRLYMTCLCIMTLEVYYRHLPLYQYRLPEETL